MIIKKINEVLKHRLIRDSLEIIICLNKNDFEEVKLDKNIFWTCKAEIGNYSIWKFDLNEIAIVFVASSTCPEGKIFVYSV